MYNWLPKYLRDMESVKTEKFKLVLDKFLELIPDEPKMPNYVTAAGSNSILHQLPHLWAQRICRGGGVRLGHGAVLAASKPLQVSIISSELRRMRTFEALPPDGKISIT